MEKTRVVIENFPNAVFWLFRSQHRCVRLSGHLSVPHRVDYRVWFLSLIWHVCVCVVVCWDTCGALAWAPLVPNNRQLSPVCLRACLITAHLHSQQSVCGRLFLHFYVCVAFFSCVLSRLLSSKRAVGCVCSFFFHLLTFPNPATNASIVSNYTVVSTSRSLQLMHYYCHCSQVSSKTFCDAVSALTCPFVRACCLLFFSFSCLCVCFLWTSKIDVSIEVLSYVSCDVRRKTLLNTKTTTNYNKNSHHKNWTSFVLFFLLLHHPAMLIERILCLFLLFSHPHQSQVLRVSNYPTISLAFNVYLSLSPSRPIDWLDE